MKTNRILTRILLLLCVCTTLVCVFGFKSLLIDVPRLESTQNEVDRTQDIQKLLESGSCELGPGVF